MKRINAGGRPQFRPTADQRRQVETLSGWGIPQANICLLITGPGGQPISEHTLRKHFRAELDTGMVKANAAVIGNLWKHASKGTGSAAVTACIWWTKTRCGWKETSVLEHGGTDGGPLVISISPTDNKL